MVGPLPEAAPPLCRTVAITRAGVVPGRDDCFTTSSDPTVETTCDSVPIVGGTLCDPDEFDKFRNPLPPLLYLP